MLTVKIAAGDRRDWRHLIDKAVMRCMPRATANGGLIAETQARAGILHVGSDMLVNLGGRGLRMQHPGDQVLEG